MSELCPFCETYEGEHLLSDCHAAVKARISALETENSALKAEQAWHPASEPPEEGQEIWAREANNPIIGRFIFTKKLFNIFLRHYTHWQPVQMPELPAPPEVENE